MCREGNVLTIVHLSGGLGNQLFQYFDGARKSLEASESLILDFSGIQLGKVTHGSSLSSINLPVKYDSRNVKLTARNILIRRTLLSLEHRFHNWLRIGDLQNSHLKTIQNQNFLSYETIAKKYSDWKPELTAPSDWYIDLLEATKETKFIALHVRQGDYLEDRNFSTIGVLDTEYYVEAIRLVTEQLGPLPIWGFSDSNLDNSKLNAIAPGRLKWINPPAGTDAAESLLIMSRASGIILANSTFSWWAVTFGSSDAVVVAPYPWFRELDQPQNLIRPWWRKVPSSWMTRGLNDDVSG